MPIVEIELVTDDLDKQLPPNVTQQLADLLGNIFESKPGQTWVKFRALPRHHYAENQAPLPHDVAPVFVHIMKAKLPELRARSREVAAISEAIAATLEISSANVHIIYLPEGRGRVAFGGKLVTD